MMLRVRVAFDCGIRRAGEIAMSNVLFFDVDNTLLNNDEVTADLREHLERELGS